MSLSNSSRKIECHFNINDDFYFVYQQYCSFGAIWFNDENNNVFIRFGRRLKESDCNVVRYCKDGINGEYYFNDFSDSNINEELIKMNEAIKKYLKIDLVNNIVKWIESSRNKKIIYKPE